MLVARIWAGRAGRWETVLKKAEEVHRGAKVEEVGESESIDSDEAVDIGLEGMEEVGNGGGVAEERGVDARTSSEKAAVVAEEEHEKHDDVDLVVAEMVVDAAVVDMSGLVVCWKNSQGRAFVGTCRADDKTSSLQVATSAANSKPVDESENKC